MKKIFIAIIIGVYNLVGVGCREPAVNQNISNNSKDVETVEYVDVEEQIKNEKQEENNTQTKDKKQEVIEDEDTRVKDKNQIKEDNTQVEEDVEEYEKNYLTNEEIRWYKKNHIPEEELGECEKITDEEIEDIYNEAFVQYLMCKDHSIIDDVYLMETKEGEIPVRVMYDYYISSYSGVEVEGFNVIVVANGISNISSEIVNNEIMDSIVDSNRRHELEEEAYRFASSDEFREIANQKLRDLIIRVLGTQEFEEVGIVGGF